MTRWQAALFIGIALVFGALGGNCAATGVELAGESLTHPHPRGVCVSLEYGYYGNVLPDSIFSPTLGSDGTVSCRSGRFVTIEPQRTQGLP